jgi:glycine oxidase
MHKKILIIGGGVAGVCLAHRLMKLNQHITLVDDGKNVSSVVAAGIVHPMSFRRTLLSWKANPFYFEAKTFFAEMEAVLNARFYHPIMVRRLFASMEESVTWNQRLEQTEFKPFMHSITPDDTAFEPFGSGRVDGFWIDAQVFITESHKYLAAHKSLVIDSFSPDDFNPETMVFQGVKYDEVVMALGYKNSLVPWFAEVPVNPTKGQLLTVKWDNQCRNTSLHRKAFALPVGENVFRIGSTYEWNNTSVEPTPEGRELILSNVRSITNDSLEVIAHNSGIRPASPDRRPMVGKHSAFDHLYIFNGLGAKGYMLAPSLAEMLCNALIKQTTLLADLHPYRFNPK